MHSLLWPVFRLQIMPRKNTKRKEPAKDGTRTKSIRPKQRPKRLKDDEVAKDGSEALESTKSKEKDIETLKKNSKVKSKEN